MVPRLIFSRLFLIKIKIIGKANTFAPDYSQTTLRRSWDYKYIAEIWK